MTDLEEYRNKSEEYADNVPEIDLERERIKSAVKRYLSARRELLQKFGISVESRLLCHDHVALFEFFGFDFFTFTIDNSERFPYTATIEYEGIVLYSYLSVKTLREIVEHGICTQEQLIDALPKPKTLDDIIFGSNS